MGRDNRVVPNCPTLTEGDLIRSICIAGLVLISIAGNALSAEPARAHGAGFEPSYVSINDCGTSPKVLDATFSEYFEGHDNIFEGTVLKTSHKPYGGPVINQCWTTVRVDRWYSTTLNQNEVFVLFETEPLPNMGRSPDEPVHCPVKAGDSILVFAGKPINEEVDSLYLHQCSHYLPSKAATYMRNLLEMWTRPETFRR